MRCKPIAMRVPDIVASCGGIDQLSVGIYASKDESEPVELLIHDEIGETWYGEGVSASSVVTFLNQHKSRDVNVSINSPGGLVYDGLVIYNRLAEHSGNVSVTIEGLAYSAASFIAMAGDTIRMHQASDFGIHRAMGVAFGNAKAAESLRDWLTTIDGHLVDMYVARTGQDPDQIETWMDGVDDGTLFSAAEALEHGFADEVIPLKTKTEKKDKLDANVINNAHTMASQYARQQFLSRRRKNGLTR